MTEIFKDTALICEGGGMRAAVPGGMLSVLIERDWQFPFVSGVSAGTTLLVNYVLRDLTRLYDSFVSSADDPNFGGMKYFLKGEGYFNSRYVYERTSYEDGTLPVNWQDWCNSPSEVAIGAFNQLTGEMKYWNRKDIVTLRDLMRFCRASSSLPILMPTTFIDGVPYADGGLGEGIPLSPAMEAGYERFMVFVTHKRGFRREPSKASILYRAAYRDYPLVSEAIKTRAERYNQQMELLETLEAEGKALVIYPDEMPLSRSDLDAEKLANGYELGREQALANIDQWHDWLTKNNA